MIKHIVMFKLKDSLSVDEKRVCMEQFKAAIESLPQTIDFIRFIRVGFNVNPDETWDICLDSEFDSLEDVKRYAVHPAHVAAASLLKDVRESRACADFEF